jgi:hypothetical protein
MDSQGNIWTQTDGTAIGKSISGDIAGIFMESYGEEFILYPQNNEFIPAFWKREVDAYCPWQYGQENIQFYGLSEHSPFHNKMDY